MALLSRHLLRNVIVGLSKRIMYILSLIHILDAQRVYFDAQIGLSNAIRDELIAVVQLYKALGGGWEQNP